MRTRAKFYVSGLTLLPGKEAGVTVTLNAVGRGDRNAKWAAATPNGNISLTINNPVAADAWRAFMDAARTTGKNPEVYVDFAPSEDGWPGDGHLFRLGDFPEGHYSFGKCGECGMGMDDKLWEYDETARKSVESENTAHPNG